MAGTVRLFDGTVVLFTIRVVGGTFLLEQFWGRAVQAPCDLIESGAFLFCLKEYSRNQDRRAVNRVVFHRLQCLIRAVQRKRCHLRPHIDLCC